MEKGVLRYCKDSHIETVRYSPSRSIPEEFDKEPWYRILTSLDPFLDSWGILHRDPLQAVAGKVVPYTCYALNFNELASQATHIVYKTYHWEGPTWVSPDKKYIVSKYYVPACVLEMEIEFVYDKPTQFEGMQIQREKRAEAVEWAGVSELANGIHEEGNKIYGANQSLAELNTYASFLEMGVPTDPKVDTKNQKLIILIKQYDENVRALAGAPSINA